MNTETITIEKAEIRKLLGAASADASLLFLYMRCGNDASGAEKALQFTPSRFSCAAATLRQLGLWPEERKATILPGERPSYSENDVLQAMDHDSSFRMLYGEVQRLMGSNLNTEELKILLSFDRYLGLSPEVISVLVSYCKDKPGKKETCATPVCVPLKRKPTTGQSRESTPWKKQQHTYIPKMSVIPSWAS